MVLLFSCVVFAVALANAQPNWCGKNYDPAKPVEPPGGEFPEPTTSKVDLLALRCAPALRPYVFGDDSAGAVVVDARVTRVHEQGAIALPIHAAPETTQLFVEVSVGGSNIGFTHVTLGGTVEIPFSFAAIAPSTSPLTITCKATLQDSKHSYSASGDLLFVHPNPFGGNTIKFEARTGALLVRQDSNEWTPIFPFGFYTSFDDFLARNLSILDDVKARGINTIHPVPTFSNITVLDQVLDRMEELGLWLMYDMRWTYTNDTSVAEEVNHIKSRKNLLLWYTGDEPDGSGDALNATSHSYDLINSLDGYHPVSLVLNCQDYFFPEYSAGADVVMQDTYPIGINATFSTVWGTVCTRDYGDCGCDNCKGDLEDISDRMDQFAQRLEWLGRGLRSAVWTVPQAFGNSQYWSRPPTGAEYLLENVLSINHGAKGSFAWNHASNTPADILDAAATLGHALPALTPFILSVDSSFEHFMRSRVDVGTWQQTGLRCVLVLATNLNSFAQSVTIQIGHLPSRVKGEKVLDGGGGVMLATQGEVHISLPATGSIGYVFAW